MSAPLSPEDRSRLEQLFERGIELPAADQAAFVARECGMNDPLRDELTRLLRACQQTNLLDRMQPVELRPAAPLQPGTRIGTYKLLERIGEGGMGEVYAADQMAPVRRRVALKVIKLGMDSHQVVARFDAERQALARMSHPHIAQVYDGGITDDGRPFFVMEFVSGIPITEYCDRHNLSTAARLDLFLEVCDGVQHAHLKGIIHRDLKPSNLLVMTQDGRACAKIIDFGVARATTGRLAEQTLHTMVGQIVGTLDYMSPEQADPTAVDIDTRSDVYSLGVVLYQLLSGLLPFDLTSVADVPLSELQRRIREQDPPTPSTRLRSRIGTATQVAPRHGTDQRTLIRQLAGDLDWICLKALEKDPARRYQSAAELAADVRRHLANEPVSAGKPGTLYRMRKFARRNRTAVSAGVMVAAFAAVGVYGLVAGQVEARAQARIANSLSDNLINGGLEESADKLWPPHPEKVAGLTEWLATVHFLIERLPEHENNLRMVRARSRDGSTDAGQRAMQRQLTGLIDRIRDLERRMLAGDALGRPDYWGIEKRLASARRLAAGFAPGGEYDRIWQDKLPAIRAAYRDHPALEQLGPQLGLLPLCKDPDSKFWLFAHLLSGEPATVVDGKVAMKPETGIVLTLLPGGTYRMGTEFTDELGPNHVHTRYERIREGPVHAVSVEPFFMSKFEMTQAQWERFVGWNPSHEQETPHLKQQPTNPVNQVEWVECSTTATRLGLSLPHEQQWEYAARGGTGSTWWTGDDPADLRAAENLQGDADGFLTITAVGSMRPNPFGLYDMLGNVSEWCQNHPYLYGHDEPEETKHDYTGRGGNAQATPSMARSGMRMAARSAAVHPACGLRLCRPVDPPAGQ